MRQKIITALALFFAFSLLFSAQLTNIASANHDHHMPPPTTSPVTGPVTGPITSPVSLFKISGHVKDHILWLWRRGAARFFPAVGVHVKAVDIFNHHTVTTTTDADGNYTLMPGKAGFYQVTVWGGDAKFYVPPVQFVNDKKPHGKNHVDFEGTIFK